MPPSTPVAPHPAARPRRVAAPRRPASATPPGERSRLVFELLLGTAGTGEEVWEEARRLGMDLAQPRAVILVDASDYALGGQGTGVGSTPGAGDGSGPGAEESGGQPDVPGRSRAVVAAIVAFFKLPRETICADLGGGVVAVLKASNSRNLDAWLDAGGDDTTPSWANLDALKRAATDLLAALTAKTGAAVTIGVGRYHPGIEGVAASYADARAALGLGRRLGGPNRVHCLDDMGVAAFVGVEDERTKIGLAHRLLSPLDHEPQLLETLDAFFAADCAPAVAAGRLGVHRNTLAYRLAKVAALTGLDPRRFDDAVQIRLARVLRELDAGPLGPALLTGPR